MSELLRVYLLRFAELLGTAVYDGIKFRKEPQRAVYGPCADGMQRAAKSKFSKTLAFL